MFGRMLLQIVFNFNLKMLAAMFEYTVFVKCKIILLFFSRWRLHLFLLPRSIHQLVKEK